MKRFKVHQKLKNVRLTALHFLKNKKFLTAFLSSFILLAGLSTSFAQTSKQKSVLYKSLSPDYDHYHKLAQLSSKPSHSDDTLIFPPKEFRLASFLKLRTVYLNVPVSHFKIKPFPANSSEQTRAELDFLLELQEKATPEDKQLAEKMANVYYNPFTSSPFDADYNRNMTSLFFIGRNLGTWFNAEKLPATTKVLENIIQDASYYFFALKAKFARPRPYHLEPKIKNPEAPGHSSYPSGHASATYIHAYLLAEIFPQHKTEFLGNAYDMAFSREIRGVHYPSDSQAGKEFAFQFVQLLLKNKQFLEDFKKMKEELIKASKEYSK